jgi:hypothetical protein
LKNRRGKRKKRFSPGKKRHFSEQVIFYSIFSSLLSSCSSSEASDLGSMGDDDEGRKTWHGVVSYKV